LKRRLPGRVSSAFVVLDEPEVKLLVLSDEDEE
jgi:hypothetical protein